MARLGGHSKQPAAQRYRTGNRRHSNKIRRAKKRYKNCPKLLQYVLENIKELPRRFKGGNQ